MLHLLRRSPSVSHPALPEFDKLLRLAVERITNSYLTDTQWLQASLPIKDGGLGVRRMPSFALPAFLASAAGTALLQTEILAIATSQNIHTGRTIYSAQLWSVRQSNVKPPSFEAVFLGPSRYREGSGFNRVRIYHSEHCLTLLYRVTAGTGYWPCKLFHVA